MKEDDVLSDLDFDPPELYEPLPELEPLPPPQLQEDLKAALAQERFLQLSGDEQFNLVAGDMAAAYQMLEAGLLAEHSGKYVAVLKRQLVGADRDEEELRNTLCQQYGVHPNRIAIIWMDDGS